MFKKSDLSVIATILNYKEVNKKLARHYHPDKWNISKLFCKDEKTKYFQFFQDIGINMYIVKKTYLLKLNTSVYYVVICFDNRYRKS